MPDQGVAGNLPQPHSSTACSKTLWPCFAGQPRFLAKDVRLSRTLSSADELNTPYTNYVGTYTGALDYVFYEPGRMAGEGGFAAYCFFLGHSRLDTLRGCRVTHAICACSPFHLHSELQ